MKKIIILATFIIWRLNALAALMPIINHIEPSAAIPGSTVTIYGKYFDPTPANNTVTFAGVAATVTSATANKLVVTVPAATTGPGDVIVTSFSVNSLAFKFTILSAPSPGAFGNQNTITTAANGAQSVYAADLDGDGDMDVLSASFNDDKIYWYENNGAGSFGAQQVNITDADGASSVYAADLDGDGDMDVLSASYNINKITWYENMDGAGSFGADQGITFWAYGANSVHAADLDGDGDIDVLSASENDDKIAWYQNNGAGSFGVQQVITTAANGAESVYAADMDGDGDMDVLSASRDDDKIAWYKNDGAGVFTIQPAITETADGARSVYAADLDGDGDMDVLSASGNDAKVAWYENTDGAGSFGVQQNITTEAIGAQSVYTADLDGDGDMDVLSVFGAKIAWYMNDGAGVFTAQPAITEAASWARSVYAADLDGDGNMDVLSASENDNKIAWYPNHISNITGIEPASAVAGSSIKIYGSAIDVNNTTVNFSGTPGTIDIGNSTTSVLEVTVPDITPGLVDVVLTSPTGYASSQAPTNFTILSPFAPDTAITQPSITTTADGASSVYAADMDGDGDMDVLSASWNDDKIAWYKNDGAGFFTAQPSITETADGAYSVYAADLDGDGDMDVLSASWYDDKIAWYMNDGTGGFTAQSSITTAADGAQSVYAADLDGDGNMDVLSASWYDDKIAWYKNDGAGFFTAQTAITETADGAYSVYAADLDGDGDVDVLSASGNDDKIAWYMNDGAGSFGAQQVIITAANGAKSVYATDLDGDGDMDVLSASRFDSRILWYRNDGAGVFTTQPAITTTANGANSVYAADLDGDGDMDVLSASLDDDKIAWYKRSFTGNDILTFTITEETGAATIDNINFTVLIEVAAGTDLTAITPVSGLSPGASVLVSSTDYSSEVTYTVTSEVGVSQDWLVNVIPVTDAPVLSLTTVEQTTTAFSWNQPAYTQGYKLEVSTDAAFSGFISGYAPKSITDAATLNESLTGLTAGTQYYVRIRAYNQFNTESANSTTLVILTKPTLPVLNTVDPSTDITQTSIVIGWGAVSGVVDDYQVEVSSTDFASPTILPGYPLTVTGISLNIGVDAGTVALTPGTNYWFRVRSRNSSGESPNSNVQTGLTKPATPVLNSPDIADIAQTTALLSWQAVSGIVDNYRVDVSDDGFQNFISGFNGLSTTSTSVTVTGLEPGKSYEARLRSENSSGQSLNSATVSFLTVPANPVATTASGITASSFQATWNSVTGADYYIVEVSEDNFSATTVRDSITSQLYADVTGLTANTLFKYRMQAGNATGVSGYSNAVSVTTEPDNEPSAQPTAITFSAITNASISISFTPAAGSPAGYIALMKEGSAPVELPVDATDYIIGNALGGSTVVFVGSIPSFTVSSLNASTAYYFSVFSYNGTTGTYNYLTAVPLEGNQYTLANEPATQATGISFSAITESGFSVSFTAATGSPAGYLVLQKAGVSPDDMPTDGTEYTAGNSIGSSTVAYVGNATGFPVTGLSSGTAYYYAIFSYNGSTGYYNYLVTSPLGGNQITIPDAPAPLTTSVSQDSIEVSWDVVTGATGYTIDVSTDDFTTYVGGYEEKSLGNVSATTISGLNPGINYSYRLRATNAGGTSANSNTIAVLTKPTTPALNAVDVADIAQTTALLSWLAVSGNVDNYRVDVSLDDFGNFLSGFNGKVVSGTNVEVTGLATGTSYKARLRSENGSGQSPNSPAVSFLTIPANPVATAAASITTSSFQATWNSVTGAGYYILEVSEDDFTTTVRDSITGQLYADVTGLTAATEYKYRLQAGNATGVSGYSNIVSVTTGVNTSPLEVTLSFDSEFDSEQASSVVEISVSGGLGNYSVTLKYKKNLANTWGSDQVLAPETNGKYLFTILPAMLDNLGVQFEVTVDDGSDTKTATGTISKSFAAAQSPAIPFELFGGTDQTWNLFSIPYKLDNKSISTIFADYDPARHEYDWRIVRYRNSTNDYVNFNTGQAQIGEAYWFNAKEKLTVKVGAGQVNSQLPFTMPLAKGWSLIGNPYPVNISWEQVILDNPTVTGVESLQVFKGRAQSTSDVMTPFSGGFVWSDEATSVIVDPRSAGTGGRISSPGRKIESDDIDEQEWMIGLNLLTGIGEKWMGGFGMHPDASLLKDRYDAMAVPRFMVYTDLTTEHQDYFYPWFSTDVVPTASNYTWPFTLASNNTTGISQLAWDMAALQGKQSNLYLLDKSSGKMVDMKAVGSHPVDLRNGDFQFEIYFVSDGEAVIPEGLLLGSAYPNPANTQTTIPVVLPAGFGSKNLTLTIYDISGRHITTLADGVYAPGYYEFTWDITGTARQSINGVFIYRLRFNNSNITPIQKKLIVR